MAEINFVSVQSPSVGTLKDNGDGTVTFTPPADFQGAARFQYTITDGFRTGTGYVYVAVYPPLAGSDVLTRTVQGESVDITIAEMLASNTGLADETSIQDQIQALIDEQMG